MGLDFVDLTLEPPAAASWRIKPAAIRAALENIVFPLSVTLRSTCLWEARSRNCAQASVRNCAAAWRLSPDRARWMNIHPDRHAPMHDRRFFIEQNRDRFTS